MSVELSFLAEEGLVIPREDTGYLRQTPMVLQQTIGLALLEHMATDTVRIAKSTIRSEQDMMYVLDTIGPCFGFSVAEYAGSIRKAMDVYLTIFSAPLVSSLRIFAEDVQLRERCLLHAIRQLTLVVEARFDHPAGSVAHIQLLSRLVDHMGRIMASSEAVITANGWSSILKMLLGVFQYACQAPTSPSECRLTLGSMLFEALVRSKTRDISIWRLLKEKLPVGYASAAQWATCVVALTRAVASVVSRRALPPCIPLAWRGIIAPTRHVTNIISYECDDDAIHMWKQLCVLVNPLRLSTVDALSEASAAIRDSTMILATASYWPQAMKRERSVDVNAELLLCSRHTPMGLSTESLLRVWGDALLHLAMGSATKLQPKLSLADLDVSRTKAVQGLCAALFRRESEQHVPIEYWSAATRLMEEVADGSSVMVRGHLLLHLKLLFQLDLPWPYHVIRKMCLFACEVLGELADEVLGNDESGAGDDEDEEGANAKPLQERMEDDPLGVGVSDAGTSPQSMRDAALEIQRAAVTTCLNVALLATQSRDWRGFEAAVTALSQAHLRYRHVPDTFQRSASAAACILRHCLASASAAVSAPLIEADLHQIALPLCIAEVERMVQNGLEMLEAPCGMFDAVSLTVSLRFVAWVAEALSESCAVSAFTQITTFCIAARRIAEVAQTDGDVATLSSLFATAVDVLGAILFSKQAIAIRNDSTCSKAIASVVECGFRAFKRAELITMRSAAHQLLRHVEVSWWWPLADASSSTSTWVTEATLAGLCTSVQIFGLGSGRIITIAQVDHEAVQRYSMRLETAKMDALVELLRRRAADLVVITRCQTGRRVWLTTKNVAPRPDADVSQLSSPRGVLPNLSSSFPALEPLALDGSLTSSASSLSRDALRFVDEQPRTSTMLEHWAQSPEVAQLVEQFSGAAKFVRFPPEADENTARFSGSTAVASSFAIEEPKMLDHVYGRQFVHDMGFSFARFKHMQLTRSLLESLQQLDAIDDRPITVCQVVYVHDDTVARDEGWGGWAPVRGELDSEQTFDAMFNALGWPLTSEQHADWYPELQHLLDVDTKSRVNGDVATSSSLRYFASGMQRILFCSRKVAWRNFVVEEDAAEAQSQSGTPPRGNATSAPSKPAPCSVRILWDATATRVDWGATDTAAHRLLYAEVCPSMRRAPLARPLLDVSIRPLLQQGLLSIAVRVPDAVNNWDNTPGAWGGPILHASLHTAHSLPHVLRDTVQYGVNHLHSSASYHPRAVALYQLLHDAPVLTSTQALVATFQAS